MKISDILTEEIIETGLNAADKNEVINRMVDLADKSGKITDLEVVRNCVFDREKLVSTGVGKGFAILKEPVDFDSIDGEKVSFVFLLVGKDSLLNTHIKLLSRISRLMNKDEFRARLLTAKNKEEVLQLFKDEEQNYIDI